MQQTEARLAVQQKAQQVAEARASQWENKAKSLMGTQKGLQERIEEVQVGHMCCVCVLMCERTLFAMSP